jgi:hypothetical protein
VQAPGAHEGRISATDTLQPVEPDRRRRPHGVADTRALLRPLPGAHVQHAVPRARAHTHTYTRAHLHTHDAQQRQGHIQGDQADTGEDTIGPLRSRAAHDGGDGSYRKEERERLGLERRCEVGRMLLVLLLFLRFFHFILLQLFRWITRVPNTWMVLRPYLILHHYRLQRMRKFAFLHYFFFNLLRH